MRPTMIRIRCLPDKRGNFVDYLTVCEDINTVVTVVENRHFRILR